MKNENFNKNFVQIFYRLRKKIYTDNIIRDCIIKWCFLLDLYSTFFVHWEIQIDIYNIIRYCVIKGCFLAHLYSTFLFTEKYKLLFVTGNQILWKTNSSKQDFFRYVGDLHTKISQCVTHGLYNYWITKIKILFKYFTHLKPMISYWDIKKVHLLGEKFKPTFFSIILIIKKQ